MPPTFVYFSADAHRGWGAALSMWCFVVLCQAGAWGCLSRAARRRRGAGGDAPPSSWRRRQGALLNSQSGAEFLLSRRGALACRRELRQARPISARPAASPADARERRVLKPAKLQVDLRRHWPLRGRTLVHEPGEGVFRLFQGRWCIARLARHRCVQPSLGELCNSPSSHGPRAAPYLEEAAPAELRAAMEGRPSASTTRLTPGTTRPPSSSATKTPKEPRARRFTVLDPAAHAALVGSRGGVQRACDEGLHGRERAGTP